MLDCADRVLVAVRNAREAAATFEALLGAGPGREIESAHLGARGLVLAVGASEVELLAPAGRGPVRDFLDARGEGLFAAGFSSARYDALRDHLARKGAAVTEE
ncbi:MAG: VOC family protein, partial [Deltaproteobacteria bacterium]|nr:VOC family protein [Deltaproteobacteria bacterium]